MLTGNDKGDWMGNRTEPICKDTKKEYTIIYIRKLLIDLNLSCQIYTKNISFNW